MRLKWTRRALRQLAETQDYIARDNPQAAHEVAVRIAEAATLLLEQPRIGRPGRVVTTKEWVVTGTPYFLVYTLSGDEIIILRVIHGKQDWP